jgi:hypothetical protein
MSAPRRPSGEAPPAPKYTLWPLGQVLALANLESYHVLPQRPGLIYDFGAPRGLGQGKTEAVQRLMLQMVELLLASALYSPNDEAIKLHAQWLGDTRTRGNRVKVMLVIAHGLKLSAAKRSLSGAHSSAGSRLSDGVHGPDADPDFVVGCPFAMPMARVAAPARPRRADYRGCVCYAQRRLTSRPEPNDDGTYWSCM